MTLSSISATQAAKQGGTHGFFYFGLRAIEKPSDETFAESIPAAFEPRQLDRV